MSKDLLKAKDCEIIKTNQVVPFSIFIAKVKNSIWMLGIPSWLFGITDRSVAAFADGYLSPVEVLHLLTTFFFFASWLYLKPEESWDSDNTVTSQSYQIDLNAGAHEVYLSSAQARMLELQDKHIIGQEYILPFHYLCQIYHLLNLKHLETIHNFSLNNLKIVKVNSFQPTASGGILQFQTVLDSPLNALRIWRQPIVEVTLILHSPYTVELSIPVYNEKKIIVIFNAIPLSSNEHKLFIDIYSDLEWPKPLLQALLHFASCLTLFEDLPYLRKLAGRNIQRLVKLSGVSDRDTMLLFRRFVELYGLSIEAAPTMRIIEAAEEAANNELITEI
ncbi:MAG: hypothetical protein KME08_04440 [Aphanothece sp. CMT-3BRIN-NPC111]|jgi:hypothetical protein|nr:hypothetical protein [Aphanothece sp. CMT-3BRIN-NPC111]